MNERQDKLSAALAHIRRTLSATPEVAEQVEKLPAEERWREAAK